MCYIHQLLDQNYKETAEMESVTYHIYHNRSTGRQWGVNMGDRSYILALLLSYVNLIHNRFESQFPEDDIWGGRAGLLARLFLGSRLAQKF